MGHPSFWGCVKEEQTTTKAGEERVYVPCLRGETLRQAQAGYGAPGGLWLWAGGYGVVQDAGGDGGDYGDGCTDELDDGLGVASNPYVAGAVDGDGPGAT